MWNVAGGGDLRDRSNLRPATQVELKACRYSPSAKPNASVCRRIGWGDAGMKRRAVLREPIRGAVETPCAAKIRPFLVLLGIILSVSKLSVVVSLISAVRRD